VHVATLETILAHCVQHPTIYLPSHDPESAQRLAGAIVSAGAVVDRTESHTDLPPPQPDPRSTDGDPKRDAANAFILMTDRYQPFQLRP